MLLALFIQVSGFWRPFQTSFGEAEGRWEGFPELSRGFEHGFEVLPTFIYSGR